MSIVSRERFAEVMREFGHHEEGFGWVLFADNLDDFHAALLAAGVFRDEAAEADEALLNQFIDNGKRIVREEQGDDHTPTTAEVERFIPPDLRRKFWERYVDKYFDQVTP